MTIHAWIAPVAFSVVLAACGGSGEPTYLAMAKTVAALQCEPPLVSRAELDAELLRAGVTSRASTCGWDGMATVAMCGVTTSSFRIIEVPVEQEAAARALGYRRVSEYPVVLPADCGMS